MIGYWKYKVDITVFHLKIHPGRLTWNLQITHLERKMIFQTSMLMLQVKVQGCMSFKWPFDHPNGGHLTREKSHLNTRTGHSGEPGPLYTWLIISIYIHCLLFKYLCKCTLVNVVNRKGRSSLQIWIVDAMYQSTSAHAILQKTSCILMPSICQSFHQATASTTCKAVTVMLQFTKQQVISRHPKNSMLTK